MLCAVLNIHADLRQRRLNRMAVLKRWIVLS